MHDVIESHAAWREHRARAEALALAEGEVRAALAAKIAQSESDRAEWAQAAEEARSALRPVPREPFPRLPHSMS